ncbi:hypothetical protein [Amycolatopsis sp. cmx-4-68]|uniref:hypothetical protein n=1 Tax=Amycolatopsis sp. cmx-4-68 TaxID=2790938 RepID=UPI00397A0742
MAYDPWKSPFPWLREGRKEMRRFEQKLRDDADRWAEDERRHREVLDAIQSRGGHDPAPAYDVNAFFNAYRKTAAWRSKRRRELARSLPAALIFGVGGGIAAYLLGRNLDVQHFGNNSDGFMWRFPTSLILGGVAIIALISLAVILGKMIYPR